jgi:chromosome partitioning protein
VRKIAVLNQKGGVGKTTTVVNVAAALAQKHQRVLVIDLDPQAHLTIHLGADSNDESTSIYDVLMGQVPISEAIRQVRENLWLLSANINLVGAESELVNEVGREIILRQAIDSIETEFDYLIIDCPPSLGLLTLNALAAAEEIIIPIQPHFLALQGFSRLLQTVSLVQTRINPALRVSAILMCLFDSRTSLSGEVREDIRNFLTGARDSEQPWARARIIPVNVRRNIKLAEAPSHGRTIFEYEPNCHGAADYLAVADFLHEGRISTAPVMQADGDIQAGESEDHSLETAEPVQQEDTDDLQQHNESSEELIEKSGTG